MVSTRFGLVNARTTSNFPRSRVLKVTLLGLAGCTVYGIPIVA